MAPRLKEKVGSFLPIDARDLKAAVRANSLVSTGGRCSGRLPEAVHGIEFGAVADQERDDVVQVPDRRRRAAASSRTRPAAFTSAPRSTRNFTVWSAIARSFGDRA